MKQDYVLSEKDSLLVFGVIKGIEAPFNDANIDLINKVGQAVEDEFCYEERVKLVHGSVKEIDGTIYISFRCLDEIEEEEIRDLELNLTAIY